MTALAHPYASDVRNHLGFFGGGVAAGVFGPPMLAQPRSVPALSAVIAIGATVLAYAASDARVRSAALGIGAGSIGSAIVQALR